MIRIVIKYNIWYHLVKLKLHEHSWDGVLVELANVSGVGSATIKTV